MNQPQPIDPRQLRKRVLLFYFAAGANLVMALWVVTAAGGQVAGGTLAGIIAIVLGAALVYLRFPERSAEQELLRTYRAEDADPGAAAHAVDEADRESLAGRARLSRPAGVCVAVMPADEDP